MQLFSEEGKYLCEFPVSYQPFSLACDRRCNLVISTMARTVELYTELQPIRAFPVPSNNKRAARRGGNCPLQVAISEHEEIFVSDPMDGYIKVSVKY